VLHRRSVGLSDHPVCHPLSGRVAMAVQVHPLDWTLKLITLQPGLLSISLGRLRQAKRLCRLIHVHARFLVYRWLPRLSQLAQTLRLRVRIRDRILRHFQAIWVNVVLNLCTSMLRRTRMCHRRLLLMWHRCLLLLQLGTIASYWSRPSTVMHVSLYRL